MYAVYPQLFEAVPSRAQRRVVQILEGAVRTYLSLGIENTTFGAIAQTCKVSRPLVQHYFSDKESLFEMVAKYIRVVFQQLSVEAIRGEDSPRRQLECWIGALFDWLDEYPHHARVWSLVYFYAASNPRLREMHTELAQIGHQRLTSILEAGVNKGDFPGGDLPRRAKMIQTLHTGGFITLIAEDLYVDPAVYRRYLVETALELALTPSLS